MTMPGLIGMLLLNPAFLNSLAVSPLPMAEAIGFSPVLTAVTRKLGYY